jgi:hypothetical protein
MKTMGCKAVKLPLLLERVGVRRIKSSVYIPPHPSLLLYALWVLWRRGAITCVDTYALRRGLWRFALNSYKTMNPLLRV